MTVNDATFEVQQVTDLGKVEVDNLQNNEDMIDYKNNMFLTFVS